ncbi:MAG: phenylalanine--tRNA ligase subunit alpha, partial [Chloroflexi bacterium]|nr:phenylalanine--tRNA ligase subunit alpha [Chloroflexota bacterium]
MTEPSTQPPSAQSIEEIIGTASAELDSLQDLEAIDQWRVSYLGRRGTLTTVLRGLASLEVEERKTVGALANQAKNTLEERLEERVRQVNEEALNLSATSDRLDVTLPGRPALEGRLHPTTQIVREICDAFVAMGFGVVEGPEVEWDHYNFEMLNIPKGHPARDMWNTLWVDYDDPEEQKAMLLRTHTSPMQARIMENREP